MKKQKIALNKLTLNKERITDLNQDQQDNVIGGGTLNATCLCNTLVCVSVAVVCNITRVGPGCVVGPVSLGAGCNVSLACTITSGGTSVIHE